MSLQLDASASQLNSNDAFILVTPGGSFLWVGVGASDPEKQGAQQLCDILGVSASELSEGGETGEESNRDGIIILHFFPAFGTKLKPVTSQQSRSCVNIWYICGQDVKICL